MKKATYIALAIVALLLAHAMPSDAHFRGGVWIGPAWGPGYWGPTYPYPSYPYPYPYAYPAPPVVIRQEPQEYIQVQPAPAQEPQYWYYCPDPQGYYPKVSACPKGWLRVVPTPQKPKE